MSSTVTVKFDPLNSESVQRAVKMLFMRVDLEKLMSIIINEFLEEADGKKSKTAKTKALAKIGIFAPLICNELDISKLLKLVDIPKIISGEEYVAVHMAAVTDPANDDIMENMMKLYGEALEYSYWELRPEIQNRED